MSCLFCLPVIQTHPIYVCKACKFLRLSHIKIHPKPSRPSNRGTPNKTKHLTWYGPITATTTTRTVPYERSWFVCPRCDIKQAPKHCTIARTSFRFRQLDHSVCLSGSFAVEQMCCAVCAFFRASNPLLTTILFNALCNVCVLVCVATLWVRFSLF